MESNKKLINKELLIIAKIWQYQLYLEYMNPEKTVKTAFKDVGSFGELLAISYNPGYIGSGSGGMGLDLFNRKTKKSIEVKTCCTIQNSKCDNKNCGAKFNQFFHEKCPLCGGEGKKINDSRFSINAKEFLNQYDKGIFDSFYLMHIQEYKQNKIDKKLILKLSWYKVDFNDKKIKDIKLSYFQTQNKKGKKSICNLLPLSFDFFKLCPNLIDEFYIEINYGNLAEQPIVSHIKTCHKSLRVPITILTSAEKEDFKKLSSYSSKDETADVLDFAMNIQYRKKTHGKNRGDTRKNVYKQIT